MMIERTTRFGLAVAVAGLVLAGSGSSNAAEANKAILDGVQHHKAEAIKIWERLVNIDSGTGDEQGLKDVSAIAIAELKKLGARIEMVSAKPAVGDNVVATFTGTGKGKILLIAHMDTVFAKGTAAARPFRIENGRAFGPGVSDDKAGIVAAITAFKLLDDLKFKNYARITVLLNTNEETGSHGTRALIERLAKEHDFALNLEAGRPPDGLVIWRKGSAVLNVEVKGRSSHAGGAPENGRNAAMELAHQVLQLPKLANRETQTTVNVTVLQSGDRTNVIPDAATARADVRALTTEEFDRVEKEVAALVDSNKLIAETEVKTSMVRGFPPMSQNARTDALAATAQSVYAELGKTLTLHGSGGAADSSFSAGVMTPSLDGLGLIGGNAHTAQEYAEVESLGPRVYLLTRLLMELGAGQ